MICSVLGNFRPRRNQPWQAHAAGLLQVRRAALLKGAGLEAGNSTKFSATGGNCRLLGSCRGEQGRGGDGRSREVLHPAPGDPASAPFAASQRRRERRWKEIPARAAPLLLRVNWAKKPPPPARPHRPPGTQRCSPSLWGEIKLVTLLPPLREQALTAPRSSSTEGEQHQTPPWRAGKGPGGPGELPQLLGVGGESKAKAAESTHLLNPTPRITD